MIPQRGFSQQNKEGGSLYDREADRGFMDGVLENKSSSVRCVTVDMHINDPAFAEKIAEEFERLLCSGRKAGKPGT